jgi:hypothetical protein
MVSESCGWIVNLSYILPFIHISHALVDVICWMLLPLLISETLVTSVSSFIPYSFRYNTIHNLFPPFLLLSHVISIKCFFKSRRLHKSHLSTINSLIVCSLIINVLLSQSLHIINPQITFFPSILHSSIFLLIDCYVLIKLFYWQTVILSNSHCHW